MSWHPRPRLVYENGCVAVPVELRRAIVGRYSTIQQFSRDFKISKYTASAVAEPYGVLEPALLRRVVDRAVELGIYSAEPAAVAEPVAAE